MTLQDRRNLARIDLGYVRNGPQKQGKSDGQNAFFAAGKDPSAEVQGRKGRFWNPCVAQKSSNQPDFLSLFRCGRNGFAKLAEKQHGQWSVSHERWGAKLRLAGCS
jgi:hypothetical protein